MFVVFDLDGTLSDERHRAHFRQQNPPDWDGYNAASKDDPVIEQVRDLLVTCHWDGHEVHIWSGRSESEYANTLSWMDTNGIDSVSVILKMRAVGDFRKSHIIKGEWASGFGIPDLVFEDRESEVQGWYDMGVPVVCMVRRASEEN